MSMGETSAYTGQCGRGLTSSKLYYPSTSRFCCHVRTIAVALKDHSRTFLKPSLQDYEVANKPTEFYKHVL